MHQAKLASNLLVREALTESVGCMHRWPSYIEAVAVAVAVALSGVMGSDQSVPISFAHHIAGRSHHLGLDSVSACNPVKPVHLQVVDEYGDDDAGDGGDDDDGVFCCFASSLL